MIRKKLLPLNENAQLSPLEQLQYIADNYVVSSLDYHKIEPLLTAENIAAICSSQQFPLSNIVRVVNYKQRFQIWQKILLQRYLLPQQEIYNIWYDCLTLYQQYDYLTSEKSSLTKLMAINESNLKSVFSYVLFNEVVLTEELIAEEMFIDNFFIIRKYCREQKYGWMYLRYVNGSRRTVTQSIPAQMREAMENDQLEVFMIYKDMFNKRMSYSLLTEIMQKKAFKIFDYLLKSGEIIPRLISLDELCICCTVQYEDNISTHLLEIIEQNYPGILKSIRDPWGRNLLWYAVLNRHTVFYHSRCRLTEMLLKYGCDPDGRNHLGLTWRFVFCSIRNYMAQQKYSTDRSVFYNQFRFAHLSYLTKDCWYDPTTYPEWMQNLYKKA